MIQVAMLWLVNEQGQLLLARRADHKSQDPGLWGPSVTGKVEAGESFEQAAVREAEEELDLKPHAYKPDFLFATDFNHPDGETREFKVFIAEVPNTINDQLRIDLNEVAEIKWLSVNDIRKLLRGSPGDMIVASAFVLWDQILEALEEKRLPQSL
jgi:isopentenyl-diphosphate Delta-isomerase